MVKPVLFSAAIVLGKFSVLIFLMVLSFINGHNQYISKYPHRFVKDSCAVGMATALAVAIISVIRGRSDTILNLGFTAFFLFFTFNVIRELSGSNTISRPELLSVQEKKQYKLLKWPVIGAVLLFFVLVTMISLRSAICHPMGAWILALEAAVFAVLAAAAEGYVAKNHDESKTAIVRVIALNFVLVTGIHFVLQWGGFYEQVFAA